MSEKLNWEKKEKLNFTKVLEQIGSLTEQVVCREINDICSKIEVLEKMGFIKENDEQLKKLKEKIKIISTFKKE